jgi:hypothetical protein
MKFTNWTRIFFTFKIYPIHFVSQVEKNKKFPEERKGEERKGYYSFPDTTWAIFTLHVKFCKKA